MNRRLVAVLTCGTALVSAAPAHAGWSTPQSVSAPYAQMPVTAVDGHGNSAVAWASRRLRSGTYSATVNIATRTASGRVHTRTLWSATHAEVTGVAVVIDRKDNVTVAFESWDRTKNEPSGVVRATYGTLTGGYTAVKTVGKAGTGHPWMAVNTGGAVLVSFNGRFGTQEHAAVAWRKPGHSFGAMTQLTAAAVPYSPDGLQVAFDARNTAYVWGECNAIVLRAASSKHKFTSQKLAPQAVHFTFSVNGKGDGVATWGDGRCSFDIEAAPTFGPVKASVLSNGSFGPVVTVSDPAAVTTSSRGVSLYGIAGALTWTTADSQNFYGNTFTAALGADGTFGAPQHLTDGYTVLAADAAGDQLLGAVGNPAAASRVAMLSSDSGAVVQPAPAAAVEGSATSVGLPTGRGAAVAWPVLQLNDLQAPHQRIGFSVWHW